MAYAAKHSWEYWTNIYRSLTLFVLVKLKLMPLKLTIFKNFTPIAMERKCKKHKYGGIHGICVLVKKKYSKYIHTVQETCSESVLWLKVDKEAFGHELILGAVYLPDEGSIHCHDEIYDNVASDVVAMNCMYDVPILLIGDFNSSTGIIEDFISIDDVVLQLATTCGIELAKNYIFE